MINRPDRDDHKCRDHTESETHPHVSAPSRRWLVAEFLDSEFGARVAHGPVTGASVAGAVVVPSVPPVHAAPGSGAWGP